MRKELSNPSSVFLTTSGGLEPVCQLREPFVHHSPSPHSVASHGYSKSALVGVCTPQKSVNTANQGFSPPQRDSLNIYQQTTACHPPKIYQQNLSNFLANSSLINSCSFSQEKKKNPRPIILPSEYTAFAVPLLESLVHLITAIAQAFLLFSAFYEMSAVLPQSVLKWFPGEISRWLVCKPQHVPKKALRLLQRPGPLAADMSFCQLVSLTLCLSHFTAFPSDLRPPSGQSGNLRP